MLNKPIVRKVSLSSVSYFSTYIYIYHTLLPNMYTTHVAYMLFLWITEGILEIITFHYYYFCIYRLISTASFTKNEKYPFTTLCKIAPHRFELSVSCQDGSWNPSQKVSIMFLVLLPILTQNKSVQVYCTRKLLFLKVSSSRQGVNIFIGQKEFISIVQLFHGYLTRRF